MDSHPSEQKSLAGDPGQWSVISCFVLLPKAYSERKAIQTMINLLFRELFDRLYCLRQNTAHRGRRLIDAGQRGQRGS